MSEPLDVRRMVDAARDAAEHAGVVRAAADGAMDAIVARAAEGRGPWDTYREIGGQIGLADSPELQDVLIKLRDRLVTRVVAAEVDRLERAFARSPNAGWDAWLTTLSNAIPWASSDFCTRLSEYPFPFPAPKQEAADRTKYGVKCMFRNRWPEAYDALEYLSEHDCLPDLTRARLLGMLGQIQQWQLNKIELAKGFYDAAAKLAPDDGLILIMQGDYAANVGGGGIEAARPFYERAIEVAPEHAGGFTGFGDHFEKQEDFETAEQWFLKAIASASGDNLGYDRLLRLYGRPELLQKHEAELESLVGRRIAVEPDGEYDVYLAVGRSYLKSQRINEAQEWYERAIALDETRTDGYTALASCYEERMQYDEAEVLIKKAIHAAPESPESYFPLALLYRKQERWAEALEVCREFPQQVSSWAATVRIFTSEMHAKLGDYDKAEEILKGELRADNANEAAKNMLRRIATHYYSERHDKRAAKRVCGEILEILGESYRGEYHNHLGDLYYSSDLHAESVEEYRQAIAVDGDNADYHRNLGLAYQKLKDYQPAGEEFEAAYRLDKDESAFKISMALLVNAKGNEAYAKGRYRDAVELYEKAIEFEPNIAVLHGNLGVAWERLKQPGNRLEALDNAKRAFEQAQAVSTSATDGYEADINRVVKKRKFASCYGEKALDWLHVVTPIAVEVASNLIPYVEGPAEDSLSEELSALVTRMRDRLQDRFGVSIPGLRFRGNETDLPDGIYIIMINEVPLVSGTLKAGWRFCPEPKELLSSLDVETEAAYNVESGGEGFWIRQDHCENFEEGGLELWSEVEYLIKHMEAVLQSNLGEFLGHQELVEILETESPRLIEEIRASNRPEKLSALVAVCRSLLAEEVPIRPFPAVADEFDQLYSHRVGLGEIAESVRLLPPIRTALPGNDGRYALLEVGRGIEREIQAAIYEDGVHSTLAMEPERCQSVLSAVRNKVDGDKRLALLIETAELRPFVRLLTELEFPKVPVLARRELMTEMQPEMVGVIDLEEEPSPSRSDFRNMSYVSPTDDIAEPSEVAIRVAIGDDLVASRAVADDQPLEDMLSLMQDGLFYELGLVLPQVQLQLDETLEPYHFRIQINGVDHPPCAGLQHNEFLVNDTVDRLTLLSIEGRSALNPANGMECTIVQEKDGLAELCRTAGLVTWGPPGYLVLVLAAEIRRSAASFQTFEITQGILDSLKVVFPELVDLALGRYGLERIYLVLRDLLEEGISIRDLRNVLEGLLSINGTTNVDLSRFIVFPSRTDNLCPISGDLGIEDLAISDYSNYVRTTLKKYISHKYTRGGNTLVVYLIDPAIEKRVAGIATQPMSAEEDQRLKSAIRAEVGNLPPTGQSPVLLTTMEIRRTLRKMIEAEFPELAVLSYQELSPDMNIQPIARISWN